MRQFGTRLVVIGAAACALAGCNQTTASPTAAPAAPEPIPYAVADLRDLTPAERKIVGEGVARGLKDPDSAKFEWGKFPKTPPPNSPVHYCGMVNAKNSYGGYTGSKPFIAIIGVINGKITTASMGAAGSDQFASDFVRSECKKHGLDPYLSS